VSAQSYNFKDLGCSAKMNVLRGEDFRLGTRKTGDGMSERKALGEKYHPCRTGILSDGKIERGQGGPGNGKRRPILYLYEKVKWVFQRKVGQLGGMLRKIEETYFGGEERHD